LKKTKKEIKVKRMIKIDLLEQNQDKINWFFLSENPNAIHLLEQNQDKIHWYRLSGNPSIFYENVGLK
jgi:hypothetical protein